MDRRIRSVELKKVIVKTSAASSDAADEAADTPADPAGTVYAPTAVNPWKRIYKAYYHGYNVTGQGSDRVDIWFDGVELDAETGEGISVSNLYFAAKPTRIDRTYLSAPDTPSYSVRAHGDPEWSTSATNTRDDYVQPSGYLEALDSTVDHTYLISHGAKTSFTAKSQPLLYRQAVVKHSATTTTATITLNSGHHYKAGDIIEVNDLPTGYRGIDGIFKIASATTTTITYEFDSALSASISEANASSGVYIYSVACKYRRVGSTLFDSNNKVYYWNGLRYQTTAVEGLTNDGSAPSPPTDLTISKTAYAMVDGSQRARVDLGWTAPTTSANGNALDDLAGYRVYISETGLSDWTQKLTFGVETSQTIIGLEQDKTYYFRVIAYDSFGNDSVGLDSSGSGEVTPIAALSVVTPSAPIIPTPRLGIVKVSWDGKDNTAVLTPLELLKYIEVHASTTSGFTPGSGTLQGKIYSSSDTLYVSDLTYNATYYFKFIAVDKADNATSASTQTSTVVKPLVDADLIAAALNAPLSTWPFAPKAVTAGALADGSLDASTVFGTGVITQTAIAADAIGADQMAANAITAGKIATNAVTADKIDALAVTAGKIAANAVEADKINAGAVTADKISAAAVTAAKITASDVFYFSGNNGTDYVRIGYEAVGGYSSSIGLNFRKSGTTVGWLGTWGTYGLEYGSPSGNNVAIGSTGVYIYSGNTASIVGNTSEINIDGANGTIIHEASYHGFYNIGLSTYTLYVNAISNVKTVEVVGRNSTTNTLLVTGRVTANGTVLTSSRTFKEDIKPYSVPEAILDIPIVSFKYNNKKLFKDGQMPEEEFSEETIGVIAEDLEDLGLHDFVSYEEGNPVPTGVDYSKLGVALIPIIKSMKLEIEALKTGGLS
jgi:hypothetical protein